MVEIIKVEAQCYAYIAYKLVRSSYANLYKSFCDLEEQLGKLNKSEYLLIPYNIQRFMKYISLSGYSCFEPWDLLKEINFKQFFKQFELEYVYEIEKGVLKVYERQ